MLQRGQSRSLRYAFMFAAAVTHADAYQEAREPGHLNVNKGHGHVECSKAALEPGQSTSSSSSFPSSSSHKVGDPDPSKLPRVHGRLSVAELKAETLARRMANVKSSATKQHLLSMLREGSICISQTPEYAYVEKVRQLIDSEERELCAREWEAQLKARREQQAKEEQALRNKLDALNAKGRSLHTKLAQNVHPCALAPADKLVSPMEKDSFVKSWDGHTESHISGYLTYYSRAARATCDVCHQATRCSWSCESCDFDICASCFEVESLPQEQRAKRRKQLAEEELRRQKQVAEEQERARKRQREEYERRQKEEQQRKEKVLEQHLGKFAAKHTKVPPGNARPQGTGFTVWNSCGYAPDGWHSYAGPPRKEFDSSWDSAKDANQRALYLFYCRNPWGLDASEMIDGTDVDKTFTGQSKLVQLRCHPADSEVWTVGVVPDTAFQHLDHAGGHKSIGAGGSSKATSSGIKYQYSPFAL